MSRDTILDTIDDLVSDFLYYDRKEDEELPLNVIEQAVLKGEVSISDMVAKFEACLRNGLSQE